MVLKEPGKVGFESLDSNSVPAGTPQTHVMQARVPTSNKCIAKSNETRIISSQFGGMQTIGEKTRIKKLEPQ
jgi:hypothetical protein